MYQTVCLVQVKYQSFKLILRVQLRQSAWYRLLHLLGLGKDSDVMAVTVLPEVEEEIILNPCKPMGYTPHLN